MNFKDDETFCKVIRLVLNSEGKYSNNPRDKGGPTMHGVAWNYNAGYLQSKFNLTAKTIQQLTVDQARQLYYDKYWLPSGAAGITDVDLAYIHIDAAINCGVGKAFEWIQKLSFNPKHFDGRGGKNRTVFLQCFLEYVAHRLSYYTHCKDRDVFLDGWVNRIVDVIRNAKDLD